MTMDDQPKAIQLLILAVMATMVWKLCMGCGSKPAASEPSPRMVVERRPCLDSPPPVATPVDYVGPAGGCPAEFTVCLERRSLMQLVRFLYVIERWARDAWTACGPKPQPPATGGSHETPAPDPDPVPDAGPAVDA